MWSLNCDSISWSLYSTQNLSWQWYLTLYTNESNHYDYFLMRCWSFMYIPKSFHQKRSCLYKTSKGFHLNLTAVHLIVQILQIVLVGPVHPISIHRDWDTGRLTDFYSMSTYLGLFYAKFRESLIVHLYVLCSFLRFCSQLRDRKYSNLIQIICIQ